MNEQTVTISGTTYVIESRTGFDNTPRLKAEMASKGIVGIVALRKPRGSRSFFSHVMADGSISRPFHSMY